MSPRSTPTLSDGPADGGHTNHGHTDHVHDDPLHGHIATTNRKRLWGALALLFGFMVAEVVVGFLADSIALLADAGHMVVDCAAIVLALVALRYAGRPAGGDWTFGWRRLEIVAAQLNGLTLAALAVVVAVESVRRLIAPPDVGGASVLVVAAIGAIVNLGALAILAGADRRSLNLEGAYQHVLMDLLGSIAAITGGIVILTTGYERADAMAALAVAVLMARSAWRLVLASTRVLLEAAPAGVGADEVGQAMARIEGVGEVHDLHLWEVTSGFPSLSAHLVVGRGEEPGAVRRAVEADLRERFGISHVTLQTDVEPDRLHSVGPRERPGDGDGDGV